MTESGSETENRTGESAEKKSPHYIYSRLLKALKGEKTEVQTVEGERLILPDKGAYLWGQEDQETGKGIFNHVLLCSRVAHSLAKELKDKEIDGYKDINLEHVVHAALLHDIDKLYAEERENLSPEIKKALGIPLDFQESSPEVDQTVTVWLKDLGFSTEVYEAIKEHNFPEKVIDNPYWKIVLVADYMAGQKIMSVEDRLRDVKTRWIDQRLEKGEQPRIEPERFTRASENIRVVAKEIFSALETSDEEFIQKHRLNNPESQTRWERFLTRTREKEKEGRAEHLVKKIIGS